MPTTHADIINADLLAFLKTSCQNCRQALTRNANLPTQN
jgi:hypothetical protein